MRSVAATSQRTAAAMAELAATIERRNVLSQTVLVALTDVSEVASALCTKGGQFLHAMAQDDICGRHYACLPCNDAARTLIVSGSSGDTRVGIEDISRSHTRRSA